VDTLVRGIAIGFVIAASIGPIALLCIHRTLSFGFTIGFSSGAGAALADTVYALLVGLALSFVTSLCAALGPPLHIAGGAAITCIGIRTILTKRTTKDGASSANASHASAFLTTFALTMVNPLTILSFAAFVSGSTRVLTASTAIDFAAGVGIGSLLWWLLLSGSLSVVRRRLSERVRRGLDLLSGSVLLFFGLVAFLR